MKILRHLRIHLFKAATSHSHCSGVGAGGADPWHRQPQPKRGPECDDCLRWHHAAGRLAVWGKAVSSKHPSLTDQAAGRRIVNTVVRVCVFILGAFLYFCNLLFLTGGFPQFWSKNFPETKFSSLFGHFGIFWPYIFRIRFPKPNQHLAGLDFCPPPPPNGGLNHQKLPKKIGIFLDRPGPKKN